MGDSDTEVPSKRKRNDSGSQLDPDPVNDEEVIEIDTGENTEIEHTQSLVDDQRKDFFIGETGALSDNEKSGNIEFTAWTEILRDGDFNHDNSYQARVLGKKATEQNESSYDELIEVCPDDVKMEPMDSTEPAGYEYVVVSTDDTMAIIDQSGKYLSTLYNVYSLLLPPNE